MSWTELFSVENTALTVLGYPLSWIELLGTVLYLWSVWLIARRRMLTWPVGILSVLLYLGLFMQIGLYSDALEQVYYLVISVYGWVTWNRSPKVAAPGREQVVARFSPRRTWMAVLTGTSLVGLLLGLLMTDIHNLLPRVFTEPASYPFVDALTTAMSFTAMGLLALRRTEAWVYWIVVDVVAIWLYWVKDARFLSILYVVLLALAVKGLIDWLASDRDGKTVR